MLEDIYKKGKAVKNTLFNTNHSFIFYIIALQLASILIVWGKGAGQIYLDMFLILLGITVITYYLAKRHRANIKIVVFTIVLLTIGTMLQCIFRQEAVLADPEFWQNRNPALSLQVQYIIAFVAALLVSYLYRRSGWTAKPKVISFITGASMVLYLFTLILGQGAGNVKNWISIGGFSIQPSEINKVLYLFIMAGLLGGIKETSRMRVKAAIYVTILHIGFLAVQSEFGTMLLILTVFLVYLLLFVPELKYFLGTLVTLIGGGTLFFIAGNFVKVQTAAQAAFTRNGFIQFFLASYNKIANRFIYWLHPEQDPLGAGFQILKAKEAILMGGWFGTDSVTNLPVKTSDMVFPALIERCGVILALVVLVVITMLWLEGIRVFIRKKDKYHRAVCAGIVFMLFYQALIIVGGSCGMCPLTGITLPFISSGGTSLMISAIMVGIVITISGDVKWEGEMDHEEMEFKFFKKNADRAKRIASFCHSHAVIACKNLRDTARNIGQSRRGEGQGDPGKESEGIHEGTDQGSER